MMRRIVSERAQVFERVELIGGVAAADQRAHRGADDDVGLDAVGLQRPHHADMGKAARRAAAEHKSDRGSAALDAEMAGVDRFALNVDITHQVLLLGLTGHLPAPAGHNASHL